jgi:hypothetical protein
VATGVPALRDVDRTAAATADDVQKRTAVFECSSYAEGLRIYGAAPNHYRVAGRVRQGEDIAQARTKQKRAENVARR